MPNTVNYATQFEKQYTIESREKDAFIADGFDILDENGNLIAEGAGKQVPAAALKAVQAENKKLKAENKKLKAENAQLKTELDSLKADEKKK